MKLKLKGTPEQIELIKAMGSRNPVLSLEAQEAFAAFIQPVILKVITQAATHELIYENLVINEEDNPTIPLDLFYAEDVNYVQVWSQSIAGGLPTSMVEGSKELRVATFPLDSAVGMLKKWARKSRLDVVSKSLQKMAQEVLVKVERNAWAVALKALAEGSTRGLNHIITTGTANVFQVSDLSNMITRGRRISSSFANGTPDPDPGYGPTDLFVSPEIKGAIRNFAYNPMNTVGSQSTGPVALPDRVREEIYRSAGTSEIFGINIIDLIELGDGQKYNILFGNFARAGISFSGANFDTSADTICVGVDASKTGLVKLTERDSGGGTLVVNVDDQWPARADKMGWYAKTVQGFACIDSRTLSGLIV